MQATISTYCVTSVDLRETDVTPKRVNSGADEAKQRLTVNSSNNKRYISWIAPRNLKATRTPTLCEAHQRWRGFGKFQGTVNKLKVVYTPNLSLPASFGYRSNKYQPKSKQNCIK